MKRNLLDIKDPVVLMVKQPNLGLACWLLVGKMLVG